MTTATNRFFLQCGPPTQRDAFPHNTHQSSLPLYCPFMIGVQKGTAPLVALVVRWTIDHSTGCGIKDLPLQSPSSINLEYPSVVQALKVSPSFISICFSLQLEHIRDLWGRMPFFPWRTPPTILDCIILKYLLLQQTNCDYLGIPSYYMAQITVRINTTTTGLCRNHTSAIQPLQLSAMMKLCQNLYNCNLQQHPLSVNSAVS